VISFYDRDYFFPKPLRVLGLISETRVLYKMAETKGICLYLQKIGHFKMMEEIK